MSQIADQLWLCDQSVLYYKEFPVEESIRPTVALSVMSSWNPEQLKKPEWAKEWKYVEFIDSPFQEQEFIIDTIIDCVRFIKENIQKGEIVSVNCAMGVSRSATVVIAYYILTRNVPFDIAFDYVKQHRPIVNPNYKFIDCLKELDMRRSCGYQI